MSIKEIAIKKIFEQEEALRKRKEINTLNEKLLNELTEKAKIHSELCRQEIQDIFFLENKVWICVSLLHKDSYYISHTEQLVLDENDFRRVKVSFDEPISPEKYLEIYSFFETHLKMRSSFAQKIINSPNSIEYILEEN